MIKRIGAIFTLVLTFVVGYSDPAMAQTLGGSFANVINSFSNFADIFTSIAYISGIFMGVWAIFKFKDHVDNPAQTKISEGVKRLIAGGMFLALPMVIEALAGTIVGTGGWGAAATTRHAVTVAAAPTSLDEVAVAFIADIAGPLEFLITMFAYLAGIALALVGISRLTKSMQEGPRGPAGMGTVMTFLVAGALMSTADMVGSFATSMFGDEQMSTYVTFTPTMTTALGANADQIAMTIEAVMVFVMLVGYIAFVRGWFVLKAVADGSQQVSLTQALTFLFGGALAINLGDLINVIQNTLGYDAFGFTFT